MSNLAARVVRTICLSSIFIALVACSSGGGGSSSAGPHNGARGQVPAPQQQQQAPVADDDDVAPGPKGPPPAVTRSAPSTTNTQSGQNDSFVAPPAVLTGQGGSLVGGAPAGTFQASGNVTTGGWAGSPIAGGGSTGWTAASGNTVNPGGGAIGLQPPGATQPPGQPASQPAGGGSWINPNVLTNTTGATDNLNNPYSDAYDDLFLGMLKKQMDNLQLPEGSRISLDKFRSDSIDLSRNIRNIWFYTGRNRQSKAVIEVIEGDKSNVVQLTFQGTMTANQIGVLPMISSTAVMNTPLAGTFNLTALCVDNSPLTCQNVVLILEQLDPQTGVACKRAYAIHRYGDAHFRINTQSLVDMGPTSSPAYNTFLDYLRNTICFVDSLLYRDNGSQQWFDASIFSCNAGIHSYPAMESLGLRNWAVAYGDGEFDVIMKETTNANTSVYANDVGSYMRDVTVFSGPMKSPGGSAGYISMGYDHLHYFSYLENVKTDETPQFDGSNGYGGFSQYFRDVLLAYNNGKGIITLHINFDDQESLNMDIISLVYQTMSIDNFNKLVPLIPHAAPQPAPAPEAAPAPAPRPAPVHRRAHHYVKKQTGCPTPTQPKLTCSDVFKEGLKGPVKNLAKSIREACCNSDAFGKVDFGPDVDSYTSIGAYHNVCGVHGS